MSDNIDELKKQNKLFIEQLKHNQNILEEMKLIFTEIRNWQKIAHNDKVKPLLETILDDPKKIAVYHISNGENTTRIISERTGAGTGSVSRWWNEWIEKSIAIPIPKGVGFRAKKMFNLENYQIYIPKIPQLKKSEKKE